MAGWSLRIPFTCYWLVPRPKVMWHRMHLPDVLTYALLEYMSDSTWTTLFSADPTDARWIRTIFERRCRIRRFGLRESSQAQESPLLPFRHTAGSIVHAKTADLKLAEELLGHARVSTTSDIYVHAEKLAEPSVAS